MGLDQSLDTYRLNNRVLDCMDAWFRNLIDSGIQRPANGVIQLVNEVAGSERLPELHFSAKPLDREPGTTEWYFGQLGTGTGILADLFLLRSAGRGILSGAGLTGTGSRLGLLTLERQYGNRLVATRTFGGAALETFALGTVYEGVFRPVHEDEKHEFWQARIKNGVSGGATYATFEMSLRALRASSGKFISEDSPLVAQWGRNVTMGATAGFGAGVVNASTRSLLSDQEFRTSDILNSAKQYAAAGALLHGSTPVLLNPVQKTTLNPDRQERLLRQFADQHGLGEQTSSLLAEFKERSKRDGISLQEQARTFATTSNFFRRDAADGMKREYLPVLGIQCLAQAADPRQIDQGPNNTCNVTTVEGRLYSKSPSDAIRVVANLATIGKFYRSDGIAISLKKDQLTPDPDALSLMNVTGKKPADSSARSFASQLFQLGAANAYWNLAVSAPDGRSVERGQLEYRLHGTSPDPNASRLESIVINGPDNKSEVLYSNGERIRSPRIGLSQMLEIERALTGRVERSRMVDKYSSSESTRDISKPNSVEELRDELARLKKENKLPVTLGMDVRQEAFWKKLNGNQPITVRSLQDIFYHVLQIVDYDADQNKVFIDGSWGAMKDFLDRKGGQPAVSVEDVWSMMQDGSSRVTRLELYDNKSIQEQALSAVRQWTNLEYVGLRGTNVTDAYLTHFEPLHKISTIDLSGTKVTNEGVKKFTSNPELVSLNLSFTAVDGKVVEELAKFPKLSALDVSGTRVTAADLIAHKSSLNLRELTLDADAMTPAILNQLHSAFPHVYVNLRPPGAGNSFNGYVNMRGSAGKIESLHISFAKEAVGASKLLGRLGHFPDLGYIQLENCTVTEGALSNIKSLPKLERLEISHTPLIDAQFNLVKDLPALHILSLRETLVTGTGLDRFRGLVSLDLNKTAITDGSLGSLRQLPSLETLDLSENNITDAAAVHLASCNSLKSVELAKTRVSDGICAQLLRNRSLESLNVSATKITDATLNLVGASQVKRLSAAATDITSAGVRQLANNTNLLLLDLSNTRIDDSCTEAISRLTYLSTLDLSSTKISDIGLAKLKSLQYLDTLDLAGTKITDASVEMLLQSTAKRVNLVDTKISTEGFKRLVASNKFNIITVSSSICNDELLVELRRANPHCFISVQRGK